MAKYFHMMHGLRGCYMPDGTSVLMVKTRRELKEAIADQCQMLETESTIGFSKKAIAQFAATLWWDMQQEKHASMPYVLPYKERGQTDYPYGIFVSVATRADYLEFERECEAA